MQYLIYDKLLFFKFNPATHDDSRKNAMFHAVHNETTRYRLRTVG